MAQRTGCSSPPRPTSGPAATARAAWFVGWLGAWLGAGLLLAGCATGPKIDWDSRVGAYTYDQAVIDFGPPDKAATLADGTRVCEWLTARGGTSSTLMHPVGGWWIERGWSTPLPDRFMRLTFAADGRLQAWKKVAK